MSACVWGAMQLDCTSELPRLAALGAGEQWNQCNAQRQQQQQRHVWRHVTLCVSSSGPSRPVPSGPSLCGCSAPGAAAGAGWVASVALVVVLCNALLALRCAVPCGQCSGRHRRRLCRYGFTRQTTGQHSRLALRSLHLQQLMPISHRRRGQDKTRQFCLVRICDVK